MLNSVINYLVISKKTRLCSPEITRYLNWNLEKTKLRFPEITKKFTNKFGKLWSRSSFYYHFLVFWIFWLKQKRRHLVSCHSSSTELQKYMCLYIMHNLTTHTVDFISISIPRKEGNLSVQPCRRMTTKQGGGGVKNKQTNKKKSAQHIHRNKNYWPTEPTCFPPHPDPQKPCQIFLLDKYVLNRFFFLFISL